MEDDYYPQATSPDGDFDIEYTENLVKNVDDLYSDTSKLKEFATGKNLTIKEISESLKKKNILKEIENNPNEHAFRNVPDYDGPYEDFASGGRVPLGGGGDPGTSSAEEVREAWKDFLKEKENGTFKGSWKEFQPIWIRANLAQGGRVPLAGGGGIMKIIQKLFKKKPDTLKVFIERRNFLKGMIGNTDNMRNKRILQEILEDPTP